MNVYEGRCVDCEHFKELKRYAPKKDGGWAVGKCMMEDALWGSASTILTQKGGV